MQHLNFEEILDQIVSHENRYDRQAYTFVREALDYTQRLVAKSHQDRIRHVSGQELLDGMRRYAIDQFGPMSKTVLNEWGITRCRDFGEIVFILIQHSVLAKTKEDRIEDFEDAYDFDDAFTKPFLPKGRRQRLKKSTKPVSTD